MGCPCEHEHHYHPTHSHVCINPCDIEEEVFPSNPCHVKASCVIYEGIDGLCLDFKFGDNYEELIAKLDEWKCAYDELIDEFCQRVNECIFVNNGLTKDEDGVIQLGGSLIQPTIIDTDNINTLRLTGLGELSGEVQPDWILVERENGTIERIAPEDLLTGSETVITANNGLSKNTSTNVQLGGTLLHDTVVNTNNFSLTWGQASAKIKIEPSLITHEGTQETSEVTRTWFKNNVGIGGVNAYLGPNSPSNNNSRLITHKFGVFTNSPIQVTSENIMDFATNGTDVYTGTYAGLFGDMVLSFPNNQVLRPGTAISGAFSYLQFVTDATVTDGNVSSNAAGSFFVGSGTLNRIIGYRAMTPVEYAVDGFAGTIDEAVGIQIDDQNNPFTVGGGTITKTYGIKQLGQNDENIFESILFSLPNLPVYANNGAALGGGLVVGNVYRTSGGDLKVVI